MPDDIGPISGLVGTFLQVVGRVFPFVDEKLAVSRNAFQAVQIIWLLDALNDVVFNGHILLDRMKQFSRLPSTDSQQVEITDLARDQIVLTVRCLNELRGLGGILGIISVGSQFELRQTTVGKIRWLEVAKDLHREVAAQLFPFDEGVAEQGFSGDSWLLPGFRTASDLGVAAVLNAIPLGDLAGDPTVITARLQDMIAQQRVALKGMSVLVNKLNEDTRSWFTRTELLRAVEIARSSGSDGARLDSSGRRELIAEANHVLRRRFGS